MKENIYKEARKAFFNEKLKYGIGIGGVYRNTDSSLLRIEFSVSKSEFSVSFTFFQHTIEGFIYKAVKFL